MIRYQNQYGYSVNLSPWLDNGYRLISLELNSSLGGNLSFGTINLVGSQDNLTTLELKESFYSGVLSILDQGVIIKEFNIFIVNRISKREELTLGFVCIPNSKYVRDLHSKTHVGNLKEIIEKIFYEHENFLDIQGESDIQGDVTLYQSSETDISFLSKVISGYQSDGIFGYSWDKLIIKKTCTPEELQNAPIIEALNEEQAPASKTYNKDLYNAPKNLWEEGKDDERVGEDYTDREPIFVRACSFMEDSIQYMGIDQYHMIMNSKKNIINLGSDYFQKLKLTLKTFPKVQIGEVVRYYRNDIQASDLIWPYEYYLVYGTRMYFSTSGTGVTDPTTNKETGDYNFDIILVGLEEDGSIALEKTKEQDPTLNADDRGDPDYMTRTNDNTQGDTKQHLPKIGL